jgi:hypothetical protein
MPKEILGNCPPNIFIPKSHPVSLLQSKANSCSPPIKMTSNNGSTVWFKQDDRFE